MRLVHSKLIRSHFEEFLADSAITAQGFIQHAKSDSVQLGIFKCCTAGYTALRAMGCGSPLMEAAAGCVRRCANMCLHRQLGLARVELRRLVECVLWEVYYSEHPVEYAAFTANPDRSRSDARGPIDDVQQWSTKTFFDYAKERFLREPSGMVLKALNQLEADWPSICADVHGSRGALGPAGSLALSSDRYGADVAETARRQVDRVVKSCVVIVAAAGSKRLRRLDAIDRAWFDDLLGKDDAKRVRGGDFGIAFSLQATVPRM